MTHGSDDLEALRSTIASVPHFIDRKRWDDLRKLFAEEVATDYTSLFGGAPLRQSGEALVEGWRNMLSTVATQHLLGPIDTHITNTVARAECHVRALHEKSGVPGGSMWEIAGHYRFELSRQADKWAITSLTLDTFLQIGNTKLLTTDKG